MSRIPCQIDIACLNTSGLDALCSISDDCLVSVVPGRTEFLEDVLQRSEQSRCPFVTLTTGELVLVVRCSRLIFVAFLQSRGVGSPNIAEIVEFCLYLKTTILRLGGSDEFHFTTQTVSSEPLLGELQIVLLQLDMEDLKPIKVALGSVAVLEKVTFDSTVLFNCSTLTIRQSYRSLVSFSVEASYQFPLPANSAVTGFEMRKNGQVYRATLMDLGQAQTIYKNTQEVGLSSVMLEQAGSDLRCRIGILGAGEALEIEIRLVTELQTSAAQTTWVLPLTTFP